MKSKKARELIEKYAVGNSRDAAPTLLKRTAILCVELAEQEAEDRMRTKACEIVRKMMARAFTDAIAFAIAREFFKELCKIQNRD